MRPSDTSLEDRLRYRGVSRRQFLSFCSFMAAMLAVPRQFGSRIAEALAGSQRLPVVWLEFQDCTGDTESFLRAGNPTVTAILLEMISLNYHETLMVPAGIQSEISRRSTIEQYPGGYIAVVEGAIPTGNGGTFCMIGGRTAQSIVQEVCRSALATIAVGTCATSGGWPGANPNPTQAVGVREAVPGLGTLISLPGCPMNVANFTATLVYYLTNGRFPQVDSIGRPFFAYGEDIHEECPRHDHYEEGRFVLDWGDEGHRRGWCLFKMGCKGPATHHNCSKVQWNDGTSWPVAAGHGCVGCAEPGFWDRMSPFYGVLPDGGDD